MVSNNAKPMVSQRSATASKNMAAEIEMRRIWLIFFAALFNNAGHCNANLALRRPIDAYITCGSPPEQYYETWQGALRPVDRKSFICNASSPVNAHPPRYMVDGNNMTHWQSRAAVDKVNITIDLRSQNQKFLFIRTIDIQFGAYQRPGQIRYLKSTDGGLTYTPWHHYVSFPFECTSKFGLNYEPRPFLVNSVLCANYPNIMPVAGNETVHVDMYGGRSSTNTPQFQTWLNVTNIKFEFTGLFQKFDIFSAKWHHYTVRGISVTGYCFCNGHGTGCTINSTTGIRLCQCQNNACGPLCDQCCPAYNQYRWKRGSGAPFEVDPNAACRACNCHNHSSVCTYNQTVADSRLSLNTSGFYSGGGVCQDCKHNTTGINCERCITYFYRPAGKSRLNTDVCKECNCNSLGTRNATGVLYLDCIRDETVNVTGMLAGDCYCKQNVYRRQCGTCRPGFFNLTGSNPLGCQDCRCFLPGTVNGSNVCTADQVGNCPCKRNTEGRACAVCKDQFFNLTANNTNGCQDCSCDPGGRSSPICNKVSGKCLCKSANITGRQCDMPTDGYFYPNLHYLNFAVSRMSPGNFFRGPVTIPTFPNGSRIYYVIIKYKSTVSAANSQFSIAMPAGPLTFVGTVDLLPSCRSTCYALVKQNFTLTTSAWNAFVNLNLVDTADSPKVSVESVVLLPSEFYNADILGAARSTFQSRCDVVSNNVSRNGLLDQTCLKGVYSLTMGLLGQPIECGCNSTGSHNLVCEKYDGQCSCKSGVTGKKCDRCLPRFYNFTSNGCTPCNCSGDNKVCDQVTGQCVCPSNTIGRTCSQCASLHWGWNSTTGCQACGCDLTGSANLQCDLHRGNCSCKYGVTGQKCSECLDMFTGFSSTGCSTCNCSTNGSLNDICNKTIGQCPCKSNSIGRTCSQCSATSYYLASVHSTGCLDCICMGITTNCSSSNGYVYQESLTAHRWRIGNETHLLAFAHSNSTIGSGAQSVPAVETSVRSHDQPVFWMAPIQFTQRSWADSYGGTLDFTITYTSVGASPSLGTQHVIMKGKGVTIYQNISRTVGNIINVRRIRMHEDSWRYSNGSIVSRSSFLLVLAKPSALLISASSYASSTTTYTARIGGLSITNVQSSVTSIGRALQVETCQCGTGYTGSSCERCASGYKRSDVSTHNYLGTCKPCECNGHSSLCDPDTGKCLNCQHNTTGHSCQLCRPGFYGNATTGTSSDCQKCPCEAPRTTSVLCEQDFNGTVRCLNCSTGYEGDTCESCSIGYFGQPMQSGGSCQVCQCSNNSIVCNTTTGLCQNCQYNTSGDRCERCRDGWYGDAILRTCQGCNCDVTGSYSNVCNHTNGACNCKPNVIGMNCTACQANSYGFNNLTGCTLCNCNQRGSLKLQCNESGICDCQNHTMGAKCDSCMPGYFGLPLQRCSACSCNLTGSHNVSCSTSYGNCFCKIGVQGRQCSSCMKQHTNFNDSGCTACPGCSQLLQRKINVQLTNIQQTYVNLRNVQLLANLTPSLLAAEQRYNATQISKQQFDSRIATLQAGINRIKSDSLSRSVYGLQNRTNKMVTKSNSMINTSSTEVQRIQRIHTQAEQAAQNVLSVNTSIQSIITVLQQLQTNSARMLANAQGLTFNFNHQHELSLAQSNASEAYSLLLSTQNSRLVASSQQTTVNATIVNVTELLVTEASQRRNVVTLQNEVVLQQTRLAQLQQNITAVQNIIRATNSFVANIAAQADTLQTYSSNISSVLTQAEAVLKIANETINNASGVANSLAVLSILVSDVQGNLSTARRSVGQATGHAANLTTQASNLTSTFQPAKTHASNAVNAVKRYEEVSRLINQSMVLSAQANRSIQEVLTYLQRSGNQNLTAKSLTSLAQSNQMQAISVSQQNALQGLLGNLSQANQTYQSIKAIGNTVSARFNTFLSMLNTLSLSAEYGRRPHSLEAATTTTNQISDNVGSNVTSTVTESKALAGNLTRMASVVVDTNRTAVNAVEMLNATWMTVNNITRKLNGSSNSTMDDINQITGYVQQFNNTLRPAIEGRLASIQSKLAALKQRIAKMQAAIKLNGSNSISYKPTAAALSRSTYSEVQLDFRTTQSNAFLMLFGNSSAASMADRMTLKVVNSKVVFEYRVNGVPRSLTNWEVSVSDGLWRRVYATRQGDFSRLTVNVLSTNYSRTYSSYIGSDAALMTYPTNSMMYLGGLSPLEMINSTVDGFNGCIDNVRVNKIQVSLWNYSTNTFKPGFCNSSKLASPSSLLMSGTSFSGSGFIQLAMGNFSIRNYSRVQFDFRTFHRNGTLFAVKDIGNRILYSIALVDGIVTFDTPRSRDKSRANPSSGGIYSDGNAYRLTLERSLNHVQITVVSVATGIGAAPTVINSAQAILAEGSAMYFGGVNDSETGQLNTAHRFAGCMMNIFLSNNKTGGNDIIKLNDASLLQYSKGVTFNGCLSQVQNGIRFLGSGYASTTTPSQRLTQMRIVFKSSEPSGVLFYSQYEGAKFYISLYHGNIFLDYKNSSRNARNVLYTRTQTLNSGQYHTLRVVFSGTTLMSLIINGITQSIQLVSGLAPSVELNGRLYVGGVPSTLASALAEFPVTSGFKGDFSQVQINGKDYVRELVTNSNSVSLAGVPVLQVSRPTPLPTTPAPTTPPPTCAAASGAPQFVNTPGWIGLGVNSTLGVRAPNEQVVLGYLKRNYLLTIEFRSFNPYGVIFFATNASTNGRQFISLELVNGKLVYQFNSGGGLVQMTTPRNYATGTWTKVYLLRMAQFGAILVPDTKEYENNRHGNGFVEMQLEFPFYFGKIPDGLPTSVLRNPSGKNSFRGCIRAFTVQEEVPSFSFNLNTHSDLSVTKNVRQCYQSIAPVVRLLGTGYILVERNVQTTSSFSIAMRLRTTQRTGILWHLIAGGSSLMLEQISGQVVLSLSTGVTTNRLVWTDPSLPINRAANMSFALCNNVFHTITVARASTNYTITVDNNAAVTGNIGTTSMTGSLYFGGSPSVARTGLVGCIQYVVLNGQTKDLASAASSVDARFVYTGCRAT